MDDKELEELKAIHECLDMILDWVKPKTGIVKVTLQEFSSISERYPAYTHESRDSECPYCHETDREVYSRKEREAVICPRCGRRYIINFEVQRIDEDNRREP